ncbi:MAG: hypothetical protein O7I93_01270 [Gemmatimonadetes bacterium]|nr:hypothetical protein [Gemmatimonadota bacterium]
MISGRRAVVCAVIALACGAENAPDPAVTEPDPVIESQESGTSVLLQAVSVVDENVVWVSGHGATYARTLDGGATWHAAVVPGPDTLQFRDVHAVDAQTAYLLSAGPGDMSRIYKTTDGGEHWTLQFTNREASAFYDCMDFWDADNGLAYSDAVDGRLIIIGTNDGGDTWSHIAPERLPDPRGSEGGFAASGTCLVVHGDGHAWIGTGAGDTARVIRTTDRGHSWTAAAVPIVSGTGSSGIFSLVFVDERFGMALGGDLSDTASHTDNVVVTEDGGATWVLAGGRPTFTGAVYGASRVPGGPRGAFVAAGPRGVSYTLDNGATWAALDTLSHWAVGFASPSTGWAVGPGGRITKISLY